MKSKEELNALKEEVDALNKKLAELTEEELAQVAGGVTLAIPNEQLEGLAQVRNILEQSALERTIEPDQVPEYQKQTIPVAKNVIKISQRQIYRNN